MRSRERLRLKDLPPPFRLLTGALSLCLLLLTLSACFIGRTHQTFDVYLEERVRRVTLSAESASSSSEAAAARLQRRVLQAEREAFTRRTTTLLVLLTGAGLLIAGVWVIILRQFCYHCESRRQAVQLLSNSSDGGPVVMQALPNPAFMLDDERVGPECHELFGGTGFPAGDGAS